MNEWNIQSRSHGCQACHALFVDAQAYHTILFDEKHEFKRLDVCDACWKTQYSEGANDRKGFISYWQGVYHAPPAAAPDPIQKENAETLLRKLIELNDPQNTAATYILAVMLERKRILKVKDQVQSQEGGRIFVYEQPRTGDIFTIPDPNLQLNQLQQVQHDVARLLEHGLEGPPDPSAAVALEPALAPGPSEMSAAIDSAEAQNLTGSPSEPLAR
jgi:hypothetical protein